MDRFDPFVKYADVYGDIINWEKDPMNKPQNQNKYFFSDGKTYYEQICKMLRLMSVFKEAFNQIYNNEDEISGAWENFVNNLSASVVEGNEPDVTLTWTDDSVNFEFTMVPGVPGDPGVGIASISFNSDYTMTITLSDGTTYTSMSLKGDTGPQGPQGETGSGLQILDVYATLADLQSAHPTGQPGDAYQVGSAGNYTLYIWSSSQSAWVQAGTLGTVSPYTSAPLMDGTASAGSQNLYARGDHVHPSDTSRASKEELDALIRTSQALIDQRFTYRESPAIQDGLARIDKIRGNTIVWNQLVKNGNFEDSTNWKAQSGGSTLSVSNGVATVTHVSGTINAYNPGLGFTTELKGILNHIYYVDIEGKFPVSAGIYFGGNTGVFLSADFSMVADTWVEHKKIIKATALTTAGGLFGYLGVNGAASVLSSGAEISFRKIQIIDLTAMFGSTKADEIYAMEQSESGSGVAYFRSLFPLPYYQYDAGSLLSFNGTGIKTVGFNQWDEEWETGTLNSSTGLPISSSNQIRSKNYNRCISGLEYYFRSSKTDGGNQNIYYFAVFFYDSDYNFVSRAYANRQTFTVPANASYFKFTSNSSGVIYGDEYLNDICINISSSENGKYEPYTTTTTTIPTDTYFPTGMKSGHNANNNTDLCDEMTSTKAITRMAKYTFTGNESVNSITSLGTYYRCQIPLDIPAKGAYATVWSKGATNKYNYTEQSWHYYVQNSVFWYFTTASTADAIRAEVAGSELCYELLTPIETAIDLDLDFMAYEDGTEQLLPANGSVPSTSPIIADMTYLSIDDAMEYIIEKLANVPLNTQQILESLEDDVSDLQTDVGELQPAVSALQTSVGNINTNIGQISSTVAGHTAFISSLQSDLSDLDTEVDDLGTDVSSNTGMINQLTSDLASTDGMVQNLLTSVSGLSDTVTDQGTTVTELDSIITDISNNPVTASLGGHELGFVLASVEATLPANTGTMVTIPKPTIYPSNYTPLFIVGMNTGSYNVSICSLPTTFGTGNSVTCRVWNHGSQQTTQISVMILCIRQRQ